MSSEKLTGDDVPTPSDNPRVDRMPMAELGS
jgi:hypothetical protein